MGYKTGHQERSDMAGKGLKQGPHEDGVGERAEVEVLTSSGCELVRFNRGKFYKNVTCAVSPGPQTHRGPTFQCIFLLLPS